MPKFTIDGIEYNTEDLNEHCQKVYETLQYSLVQLQKIENEIEIYKIAHKHLSNEFRLEVSKDK